MTTHPTFAHSTHANVPTVGHLGDRHRATVGQYRIGRKVAQSGAKVSTSEDLAAAWFDLFFSADSI